MKDERICNQIKDKTIELRRVSYWDSEKEKVYEFISNHFKLEPDKIAAIYKHRWQIETMFKNISKTSLSNTSLVITKMPLKYKYVVDLLYNCLCL